MNDLRYGMKPSTNPGLDMEYPDHLLRLRVHKHGNHLFAVVYKERHTWGGDHWVGPFWVCTVMVPKDAARTDKPSPRRSSAFKVLSRCRTKERVVTVSSALEMDFWGWDDFLDVDEQARPFDMKVCGVTSGEWKPLDEQTIARLREINQKQSARRSALGSN